MGHIALIALGTQINGRFGAKQLGTIDPELPLPVTTYVESVRLTPKKRHPSFKNPPDLAGFSTTNLANDDLQ